MTHESLVFHLSDRDVLVAPPRCGLVLIPDLVRLVEARCRDRASVPRLVLDLSAVTEWDMSVLSSLVWARRRCVAAGGDLALVLPKASLFSSHEVVCLEQLFHVGRDVDAARRLLDDPLSHRGATRRDLRSTA